MVRGNRAYVFSESSLAEGICLFPAIGPDLMSWSQSQPEARSGMDGDTSVNCFGQGPMTGWPARKSDSAQTRADRS